MEAHVCNRFEASSNGGLENEDRSVFFTERYYAHDDSEEAAKEKLLFAQQHQRAIEESLWHVNDNHVRSFLFAFPRLVQARSFLKYSYIAAWGQGGKAAHDFQNQQAILETVTEKLTQLTMSLLDEVSSRKGDVDSTSAFPLIVFFSDIVDECMDRMRNVSWPD